jgi:uncharacterized lipoprotein YajG
MKKLVILSALFLSGCQSTQLIKTKEQVVILPSETMYNCPETVYYPKPDKLTELQVAKLLVELNKNNKICKNSIESIRRFLNESKAELEAKK